MGSIRKQAWIFALCAALVSAGLPAAEPMRPESADKVYSFGVVPQFEPRKIFRIWRPILDELEQRTGYSFELVGTPKIPAFEKKFMAGEFDFAYMNPYHIMLGHDSQGYVPLVRDGGRVLKGIVVVHKNSPIASITELDGQELAFPAPNALGASLLPRADLAQRNIHVSPRYVQTHSSVYLHVAKKLTVGGGGVASTLRSQKKSIQDALRILYTTRSMSPHPVAAHPRVPTIDRKKVQHALLEMAATAKGQAMLAKIPMKQAIAASIDDYLELKSWGLDAFYVWE